MIPRRWGLSGVAGAGLGGFEAGAVSGTLSSKMINTIVAYQNCEAL
jgi:hypothetical protein